MKLDDIQLKAVAHAAGSSFSIITGGAGTGKTTIIKEIHRQLSANIEKVEMCAFAGKAAARLKEATKQDASTIHRMLQYMGTGFTRESLKGVSVIVDEASMVNSELMAEIVKREPSRLILVGDAAQLPPVGKGQPFHDIIALQPHLVVELTKCYRNSEAVFKAATAIRNGKEALAHDRSANEKWMILETGDAETTHQAIVEQVKLGFFDFDQDIILCPKNGKTEDAATVEGLNADIASLVNPRKGEERFVVNDRVMNTKNIPEKDIWNGTTGRVQAIDQDGSIWIDLDEPIIDWVRSKPPSDIVCKSKVRVTKKEAANLKLAYALSVHKSQGSQYRKVVFVCLGRDDHALLNRPLIYTAVTRTREQCVVVGETASFRRGCRKLTHKNTILQELAKGEA